MGKMTRLLPRPGEARAPARSRLWPWPAPLTRLAGRSHAWVRRFTAAVAGAVGLRFRGSGTCEPAAREEANGQAGAALKRLMEVGQAALQQNLLGEALALIDELDRRTIGLRLAGKSYDEIARALPLRDADAARSRFASAVERLAIRLQWIADRERWGVPPSERTALGRFHFFGWDAQVIAGRLRLPLEVVERWIRRDETWTGG